MSDLDDDIDDILDSDWESSDDDLLEFLVSKSDIEEYSDDATSSSDDSDVDFEIDEYLIGIISKKFEGSEHYKRQHGKYGHIAAKNQVVVFVWYLRHQMPFRDVAKKFNITISSLHKIITRVSVFLSNLSPEVITWPGDVEKEKIEQRFRANGFPGVIGAVGDFHVRIDKPENDAGLYVNKQQFHSVHMQLVCDHRKKILDICVGCPGSQDDQTVFNSSSLGHDLEKKCGRYFILGDDKYPLKKNLLVPFHSDVLTEKQINYNLKLSKNRYVVDQCFDMLKSEYPQVQHVKLKNIPYILHLIRAICVLHNMTLDECRVITEENYMKEKANGTNYFGDNQESELAMEIRDEISNKLEMQNVQNIC